MVDRNPDRYTHLNPAQKEVNTDLFCKGLQKMIDDSEKEVGIACMYSIVYMGVCRMV